MIAGKLGCIGTNFETLQFNDKHPTTNPVTGGEYKTTPFWDHHRILFGWGTDSLALSLPRVYVLTGSDTCSAGEASLTDSEA